MFARMTALSAKTSQERAVIATINAVLTRLSLAAPENIVTRSPMNPLSEFSSEPRKRSQEPRYLKRKQFYPQKPEFLVWLMRRLSG